MFCGQSGPHAQSFGYCLRSQRFTPRFSSKNFIVLVLIFRPVISLGLIFVYGVRKGSNFIVLHVHIQLFQGYLLKGLLYFIELSRHLCKKKNLLAINIKVYLQTLGNI